MNVIVKQGGISIWLIACGDMFDRAVTNHETKEDSIDWLFYKVLYRKCTLGGVGLTGFEPRSSE